MKLHVLRNELALSVLLLVSLAALFDPFDILMLTMTQIFALCIVILIFSSYVIFLFREKTLDEREEQHRFLASRMAFFFGATALVLGITIEKLNHHSVQWLILALAAMVIGKLVGHVYASMKR